MGLLLQHMGKLEEARSLFEEASQAGKETLGEKHFLRGTQKKLRICFPPLRWLLQKSPVYLIACGGESFTSSVTCLHTAHPHRH